MEIQSHGYLVVIENSFSRLERLLTDNGFSSVHILVDEQTKLLCLPLVLKSCPSLHEASVIVVPSGEHQKNLVTCGTIWDELFRLKADRNSRLINLGGGVLTDMGAFAAATYKRGIPFIQIPTTLLSMVDASVGGKTGLDYKGEKNMIGTFSNPQAVFIHPGFLRTLPPSELLSGVSEVVKHGLIADRDLFFTLEALLKAQPFEPPISVGLIARSVEIKNEIVLADPLEKNRRKKLNYGHTIGHAVESHSLARSTRDGSSPLNHGQAIAIGMLCEGYLSCTRGTLPRAELDQIIPVLKVLFPFTVFDDTELETIYTYMLNDKKNHRREINFTFLKKIGEAEINQTASREHIMESFTFFHSILQNG